LELRRGGARLFIFGEAQFRELYGINANQKSSEAYAVHTSGRRDVTAWDIA
jgi:hypothetical protein